MTGGGGGGAVCESGREEEGDPVLSRATDRVCSTSARTTYYTRSLFPSLCPGAKDGINTVLLFLPRAGGCMCVCV